MSQNPPHLPRHSPSTLSYQMICAYLAERSRYASKKKVKRFIVIVGLSILPGGRTQQMFIRGDSAPRSNPTPYPFIYHFLRKRYPFRIPSTGKWYPFYITCLELYFASLKMHCLITKIERFLDFLEP